MTDVAALLASYPRSRLPLPPANARIYVEEYKINRGTSDRPLYRITAQLESWMHHQVAAGAVGQRILDLGAGTLNHRHYEADGLTYDIVEPFSALYESSPELAHISQIYAAIRDVPLLPGYDRIASVAVLEHLEDLPATIAACGLRLSPGGVFQAGIPAEGGFSWGLAWRMTTGISYRLRTGLPYAPVMRHEHLNDAAEILAIVRYLFEDVLVRWYPLPARHFAFYGYIEARTPRLDRCKEL
jgi:SAM-dependent methyltransferase